MRTPLDRQHLIENFIRSNSYCKSKAMDICLIFLPFYRVPSNLLKSVNFLLYDQCTHIFIETDMSLPINESRSTSYHIWIIKQRIYQCYQTILKKYSDYACNSRNSYTFSLYILLPSRFCSEQLTKHMQDFNLKWFSTKDVCTHCKLIKIP